jgi:hypothetical protein
MRRTRHILAALALALTAGCELLVRIDPTAAGTGGTSSGGEGGVSTTTTSTTTTSTSTSTTSTTSTTTTTGTCTTAASCPQSTNICATAACDPATHLCSIVNVPEGGLAATSAQTTGDCKKVVCDGMGNAMSADDDTNVPPSNEVCITYTCSMGMQVTNYNAVACTENMGEVCGTPGSSAQGTCVACNVSTDCGQNVICLLNHCVTSSCTDMVVDGMETDVDCGGPVCLPCDDHLKCAKDSDCKSDVCGPAMTCTPASCSDGVKNEGETDVDCGGPVCGAEGKLCGTGRSCAKGTDCQSLDCVGTTCRAATCVDGIQNEGETDLDCGGPNCAGTCATGRKCLIDPDCVSGDGCQTTMKVCAPQCTDGHQDGNETDSDCGGGACPTCALMAKCKVDSDCTSDACDGISFLCVSNQCADHRQDGSETDTDCGGSGMCARCGTNDKCLADTDCIPADGCLTGTSICVAQCVDGHQDGNETAIDCGGGTCPTCANGQACKVDADCMSDGCQSTTKLCVSQCSDGHQDGNETAVDCGGTDSCARCGNGLGCLVGADCQSLSCGSGKVCLAATCSDGIQNQGESDVDCGGPNCAACLAGGKCVNPSDCTSSDCVAGVCACLHDTDCTTNACNTSTNACVTDQCADNHEDGNETDVDCGGVDSCPRCGNGLHCKAGTDCQSLSCSSGGVCLAATCSDGIQNQGESDIDCGGPNCSPCLAGGKCVAPTDCTSNDCVANVCVCQGDTDCATDACDALTHGCVSDQCDDHRRDGHETDVDCGGTDACARCGNGLGCAVGSDCQSLSCGSLGGPSTVCLVPTCSDGIQNQGETAVDCGGPNCLPCLAGLACLLPTDCTSNDCVAGVCLCLLDTDCTTSACDALTHTCVGNQCVDHRVDGNETDVDCGGMDACPRCGNGLGCAVGSDCQSLSCGSLGGPSTVCLAPTCSDGIQNQGETAVDCGGPNCAPCLAGQMCLAPTDCTSNDCMAGVCLCLSDTDCATDACDTLTNACVASQCSDHHKDGNETDIDCGGGSFMGAPACPTCASGRSCTVPGDCASGTCSSGTCG